MRSSYKDDWQNEILRDVREDVVCAHTHKTQCKLRNRQQILICTVRTQRNIILQRSSPLFVLSLHMILIPLWRSVYCTWRFLLKDFSNLLAQKPFDPSPSSTFSSDTGTPFQLPRQCHDRSCAGGGDCDDGSPLTFDKFHIILIGMHVPDSTSLCTHSLCPYFITQLQSKQTKAPALPAIFN